MQMNKLKCTAHVGILIGVPYMVQKEGQSEGKREAKYPSRARHSNRSAA